MNRHFTDPVFLGRYPAELAEIYGEAWPDSRPRRWTASASRSISWASTTTRATWCGDDDAAWPTARGERAAAAPSTYTETGWEVYPQG